MEEVVNLSLLENQNVAVKKDKLSSLKDKIINWAKNHYNLTFLIILFLTSVVRIYYFVLTKDQPVWWDEADYLNIADSLSGSLNWNVDPLRPILLPLIIVFFNLFGNAAILTHLFIVILSIIAIIFMYLLVGLLFKDKKVALMSSFLLAIFWSFSFYSQRILVDVPVMTLWLVTLFFFFNGYIGDKRTYNFVIAGIFLGLSFLMKFSSVVLVLLIFVYVLSTERLRLIKNLKIISMYLISLLTIIPYLIWQKVRFGSFTAFFTSTGLGDGEKARPFIESLTNQAIFSVKIMDPILPWLLALGFIFLLFEIFISGDLVLKKSSKYNKCLFIILWIIIGLLFFGWLNYGDYMDERYYFVFYPAYFIIISLFLVKIPESFKKYEKEIYFVILIILLVSAYLNIAHADQITRVKKDSFLQLKLAGDWIDKNTPEDTTILVMEESAEIIHYARRNYNPDRNLLNMSDFLTDFETANPDFIVLSFYYSAITEKLEILAYILSKPSQFIPIIEYPPYLDQNQQVPLAVIFKVNKTDIK